MPKIHPTTRRSRAPAIRLATQTDDVSTAFEKTRNIVTRSQSRKMTKNKGKGVGKWSNEKKRQQTPSDEPTGSATETGRPSKRREVEAPADIGYIEISGNASPSAAETSSASSTPVIPESLQPKNIRDWSTNDVFTFLDANKNSQFGDKHINVIQDQEVAGIAFLTLSEQKLIGQPYNMKGGPAAGIDQLVMNLKVAKGLAPQEMPKKNLKSEQSEAQVKDLINNLASHYIAQTVNMEAVKEYQKKMLGSFCRSKPLPYGIKEESLSLPMLGQVLQDREPTPRIGEKRTFSEYVQADVGLTTNHYVIAMVARSGSGKTATVVALAKKHFVIYTLCMFRGSNTPDFQDTNFLNLAIEVDSMREIIGRKFERQTVESMVEYDRALKNMAMNRVEVEFLARFMFLLLLFNKNPQLKPEEFFREQMKSGPRIINILVTDLREYDSVTIRAMLNHVYMDLKKYLNNRGLVIALDEAQIAEDNILHGELISTTGLNDLNTGQKKPADIFDSKYTIRSEYRRGFLTPLCAALDGMQATLVVLGTAFSLLNADHVYSVSSKPRERHIRITNFPMASEDDVGIILSSLLDMSGCVIPKEKKQRLSGRFRYTTYIIDAITNVIDAEKKSKQTILNEAIELAENKAKADARSDVTKLLEGNKERSAHLLCRMLIAFKLKGSHITFPQEEDADFMNKSLCVLVEDNKENYSFSMKEPLIAEVVEEELRKLDIDAEFFEYFDHFNSIIAIYGITSSVKGWIIEYIWGEALKRFFGMIIEDLPFLEDIKTILPAWCKTTKLRVEKNRRNVRLEDDIDFFKSPSDNEGIYPHQDTRPDYISRLSRELKQTGQSGQPPEEIEYWLSFASKLQTKPVDSSTNNSNTLSSDIRRCFSRADGSPNMQLKKYRQKFEKLGYPSKIKGILRIHFVFPSVAGGTPANEVDGEDVLVYIDINNMETFFDETITERAKEVRIAKKMIRYLMSSKEELEQLKKQKCRCKSGCVNNLCSCRKNMRKCTEWCICEAFCKNSHTL